ncbi:28S ribosomal protein S35, mitochondrial isoform X1 [Artibeus jamaicensis]|uniref:28S ribosomal protein S35, mitochondrial isoform X1 n=1 Tax=Artibeus jamaicensis TaxID=9417 RepID=UPI00235B116D|nr:28S ribosomal protein S35, mitochondrial isoform X1 [Artibeus jamaicensis]
MAAAFFPAWLSLQPGARTLRAFSTAVPPTSLARTPSPRTTGRMSKSERPPRRKALPPRTEKMAVDQDWPSVYPVAAPFKPSVVPLPVRMGYPVKMGVPMAKEGNLELLKIPNFLHLTPVAIKKHCEALKDFCTEWPAALDSDEKCEKHFPVEIDTADYVSSGPSVRNPRARAVTLRVKLSSLNLDDHAKKKLIKLVGERYCKTTDVLTIKTDRCPLKRQNYDYAMYLLTVLYHESWATRPKGAPQSRVGLFYQSCRSPHSTKSMWLSSSPGCRDLHSGKAAWFFPFTWERGGPHPAKTTWLPLSPHQEGVLTLLKPRGSPSMAAVCDF